MHKEEGEGRINKGETETSREGGGGGKEMTKVEDWRDGIENIFKRENTLKEFSSDNTVDGKAYNLYSEMEKINEREPGVGGGEHVNSTVEDDRGGKGKGEQSWIQIKRGKEEKREHI